MVNNNGFLNAAANGSERTPRTKSRMELMQKPQASTEVEPVQELTGYDPSELVFKPFPLDVFPKAISRYVSDSAVAMGVDASKIAVPMLTAMAAAIGNSRRFHIQAQWYEPSILWTVLVAHSGETKSSALEAVATFAEKRDAQQAYTYQKAMEEYEAESERYRCLPKSEAATATKPVKPLLEESLLDDM